MQLWFARASGITLREQLVAQVVLGILSEDLRAGERLPSTREIARRFHLHPNTISAGYRQLERNGWVESRRGSGVYVRRRRPERANAPEVVFDRMVGELFRSARALGIPLALAHARLRGWLEIQPPDHFLLIEPDEDLRRILAAELEGEIALPVRMSTPRRRANWPHFAAPCPLRSRAPSRMRDGCCRMDPSCWRCRCVPCRSR